MGQRQLQRAEGHRSSPWGLQRGKERNGALEKKVKKPRASRGGAPRWLDENERLPGQ